MDNCDSPMRLFKYFRATRLDVLRDNRIRFTPPHELNDPFEFVAHVYLSDEEYEKMCDECFQKAFALQPLLNPNAKPPSYHDWKRNVVKAMRPEMIANLHSYFEEFLTIFPRHMQVSLGGKCGLLCLSENYESLLMWAHYTDRHTGFVLEFDPEKEPFNRKRLAVSYNSERPVWKKNDAANTMAILSTKSPEWSYEREHRVVRSFEELEPHPLAGDSCKGKIGHFAALPEDTIRAVYVGCRMQNGTISELLDILKRPTYQHVQVFVGLPSHDRFTMQFLAPDQIKAISPSVRGVLIKLFGKDHSGARSPRS